MKKSLKFLAWFFVFCALYSTLVTRNTSLSTAYADSGVTYTGTLSQFLTQEKNDVNATLEMVYDRVYAKFHASGLNLMKTLNYQSLVCLGVLKRDDSLINQMQKDRQELKLSFLKDFLDIEAEIATLEEKNRIQWETDISLFAYGTTYESEKARIAQKIEQTKSLHLGFVRNFENTHMQKLQDFINAVLEYTRQNTGVVTYVNDKLRKMQSLDEWFASLSSGVNHINTLLVGSGTDFLANAQKVREGFLTGLALRLQTLIDNAIKTYKKNTWLGAALASEKEFAVLNYGLDFDEKMGIIMSDRYNKKDYEDVKAQIIKLKADYTSSGQLSCAKVYASPIVFQNKLDALINKLNLTMSGIDAGLMAAQQDGSTQSAKDKLLAWFTQFNKDNLNKKINDFKKLIRSKATGTSSSASASLSQGWATTTTIWLFTRPFKKWEKGTAIKTLQELLKQYGYYAGDINSIYTAKTLEAVYQFQLKNGLLKGYEKKSGTRWRMGPATRTKLNDRMINGGVQANPTTTPVTTSTITTGTTTTGTVSTWTTRNQYQPLINLILKGLATTDDKKAALEKAILNLTNRLATMSEDNTKIYLQGFKTALQTQLDALP